MKKTWENIASLSFPYFRFSFGFPRLSENMFATFFKGGRTRDLSQGNFGPRVGKIYENHNKTSKNQEQIYNPSSSLAFSHFSLEIS